MYWFVNCIKNKRQEKVYIHSLCRTELRNQSKSIKRTQALMETPIERKRSTRSEQVIFNFKEQCIYCGNKDYLGIGKIIGPTLTSTTRLKSLSFTALTFRFYLKQNLKNSQRYLHN